MYVTKYGYVRRRTSRTDIRARSEHRLVLLEWMIEVDPDHPFIVEADGVKVLHPDIDVHHIDRNRANNDRGNLLAVTKLAHAKIHASGKRPEPWECWPQNPGIW